MPQDALQVKGHRSNPMPRENVGVRSNRKSTMAPSLVEAQEISERRGLHGSSRQDAFFCLEKWEVKGWHEETLSKELVIERKPEHFKVTKGDTSLMKPAGFLQSLSGFSPSPIYWLAQVLKASKDCDAEVYR